LSRLTVVGAVAGDQAAGGPRAAGGRHPVRGRARGRGAAADAGGAHDGRGGRRAREGVGIADGSDAVRADAAAARAGLGAHDPVVEAVGPRGPVLTARREHVHERVGVVAVLGDRDVATGRRETADVERVVRIAPAVTVHVRVIGDADGGLAIVAGHAADLT